MMKKLVGGILTSILVFGNANMSVAGDDEWRTFGEAAAIMLGVRALTGWDPVGDIIDYPRHRLRHRHRHTDYHYVAPHYYEQRNCRSNRISAYSQSYHVTPFRPQRYNNAERISYLREEPDDDPEYSGLPQSRKTQPSAETPSPTRPPGTHSNIEISKRVEDGFEITTERIWIAPHWESTVIDGHWRGNTWVETHTEKKWVEGQWQERESKLPVK